MSRPNKYTSGGMNEILLIHLLPEDKELIREIAEKHGGTMSGYIRWVLQNKVIEPYLIEQDKSITNA